MYANANELLNWSRKRQTTLTAAAAKVNEAMKEPTRMNEWKEQKKNVCVDVELIYTIAADDK